MIRLKQVRLVNWYGFGQITVPVGLFTLIAGKNGNGKSVLLDAIKYALYGDTVFNKSTENKGSRTISSYTRGLLDATAGTYMRPVLFRLQAKRKLRKSWMQPDRKRVV